MSTCSCDNLIYDPNIDCYECPVCNKLYKVEEVDEEYIAEVLGQ